MKVAIYQSRKEGSSLEEFEVYNALKRRPDIEEIIILDPKTMKMIFKDGVFHLYFGELEILPGIFDYLIIRGGFSSISMTMELVKYCRFLGIKVFDNNLTEIRYLINKKADFIKLARAGVPIPDTYNVSTLEQFIELNLEFPMVLKPTNTGKGAGVIKVSSLEEVEIFFADETNKEKKWNAYVFEPIIDYEHDLRVLVMGGEVLGTMKRIPRSGDFRANFSLGGTVEPFEAIQEIKDLAIKAAKATGLLISGVDVLVEKTGKLWVLETNRTPGMEGITKANGNIISEKALQFMLDNAK